MTICQNGMQLLDKMQKQLELSFIGKKKDDIFWQLIESSVNCDYDRFLNTYLVQFPFTDIYFQIIFDDDENCTEIQLW